MQTIDIKALLLTIETQLKALGLENTPAVAAAFMETTNNAQSRLLPLATGYADGSMDDEFVTKQLADERNVLMAELLSYSVFGQSIAQEGRDETLNTIITTILSILMQVLVNKV